MECYEQQNVNIDGCTYLVGNNVAKYTIKHYDLPSFQIVEIKFVEFSLLMLRNVEGIIISTERKPMSSSDTNSIALNVLNQMRFYFVL